MVDARRHPRLTFANGGFAEHSGPNCDPLSSDAIVSEMKSLSDGVFCNKYLPEGGDQPAYYKMVIACSPEAGSYTETIYTNCQDLSCTNCSEGSDTYTVTGDINEVSFGIHNHVKSTASFANPQ